MPSWSERAKQFAQAGHLPTLLSAFFYFDVCFAIWVLNGAMAPFISEEFHLTPAQKGLMVSVPILSGALMRFPLGVLAEYIGRKSAAMVEMSMITIALLYGWLFVNTYQEVLTMGILLGIAGASFGVALSLGSGWYPAEYKGLAMGIAGAGNSGTVLATFFGPPLAQKYGWGSVYGIAILPMLIAMAALFFLAKEPPNPHEKKLKDYMKVLVEKDAWIMNLTYIVTFGGFIGLSNFMPTFFHDQFGISKIKAGQFTTLVVLMGSAARVVGGYLADRLGGIKILKGVLILVFTGVILASQATNLYLMTAILLLIFAGLGAGNGSVFQLVPLRFPYATAVASSLIGEIGALGGAIIPNAMGLSKQWMGNFVFGFVSFGAIVSFAFLAIYKSERQWILNWVGEGGKALREDLAISHGRVVMVPAMEIW
ncbi:MAG: NarK/NasA family nitrate transporter [Elusimicrobia bacterium]|nr:NarK/NasA family nitrate transporter [Elusimicrobiota bacterium]